MHNFEQLGDWYRKGTKGAKLADPPGKEKNGNLPESTVPSGKATTSTARVTEGAETVFGQFGYTELERDPNQQHTVLDGIGNVLVATMPVLNSQVEVPYVAPPGPQFGNS